MQIYRPLQEESSQYLLHRQIRTAEPWIFVELYGTVIVPLLKPFRTLFRTLRLPFSNPDRQVSGSGTAAPAGSGCSLFLGISGRSTGCFSSPSLVTCCVAGLRTVISLFHVLSVCLRVCFGFNRGRLRYSDCYIPIVSWGLGCQAWGPGVWFSILLKAGPKPDLLKPRLASN